MNGAIDLAVIGTSRPPPEARPFEERARALGRRLPADLLRLHTGACGGFPDAVAAGFRAGGGHVLGYSPGDDLPSHLATGSPAGNCDRLLFGFGGLIEREVVMIKRTAAVLAVGGNVGTLSELCIAVKLERPVIVVTGFPGIAPEFPELLRRLSVYPAPRVWAVEPDGVLDAVLAAADPSVASR